jgi:hypothetical protein
LIQFALEPPELVGQVNEDHGQEDDDETEDQTGEEIEKYYQDAQKNHHDGGRGQRPGHVVDFSAQFFQEMIHTFVLDFLCLYHTTFHHNTEAARPLSADRSDAHPEG